MQLSSSAALLVIDMQQAVLHPSWGPRNNLQAEPNMQNLLAAFRAARWTIVHVQHVSTEPESTFRPGQAGVLPLAGFEPRAGEVLIVKSVPIAFIGTELEEILRAKALDTLVIAGVATNNSVEGTARVAGNLGFRTLVVADACFCFDKADFHGTPRSADEVHAMSLANLQSEYATVSDTAAIIGAVRSSAPDEGGGGAVKKGISA